MPHAIIVGAGLSGLAVAFRLKESLPEAQLTVLESRSRPGGNIHTEDREGFRIEHGPNGFLDNKPGVLQLCRDLGLGHRLIPASEGSRKNRYVYHGGRIHRLPRSPIELLATPLLTSGGKLSLLREPFRRGPVPARGDESVASFARRRFGREAADVFIDALVTGIHAGDPERLSVRAAFPRLVEFEERAGSVFRGFLASSRQKKREARARGEAVAPQRMWSFREGLQVLTDTLTERVGPSVVTGAAVRRVEQTGEGWVIHGDGPDRWQADAVVLTCPAHEQSRIVADLDPVLAEDLSGIEYNRIAVVALGYRQADVPNTLDGFGYIAPQKTRRDVLGVQWCSSIFPDRAPPGHVLWRALCGGMSRPDVYDLDDETLVRSCHSEMRQLFGVTAEPVFHTVIRWPRAIPQYHLGHLDRVARIESAVERFPGLFVAGNALHGIAMNDVAENAWQIADRAVGWLTHRSRGA